MGAIYCGMTRLIPQTVFDENYAANPDYRRVSDPGAKLEPGGPRGAAAAGGARKPRRYDRRL